MKRILFVDDEPNVLEGLRSLLRRQRKEWEMTFVTGGEAALRELLATPFDVIVSDMRMPVVDGATLLRKVQQDYPHVVRIVLSGQTEQEIARRMVHVAHQFLAKPCDGRELQQVIERACNLQALLEHPALRQAVGQIGQLPVKPTIYTRLIEVLENPRSSMVDAAGVVEADIGTASKILQVVNSAFFGLPKRIGDIKTAVSFLGLEMIKMLALSVEMQRAHGSLPACPGFEVERVQTHGFLAARIARRLLPDRVKAQDAFSAAMLQDTGMLVLLSRLPDMFCQIVARGRDSGRSLADVELELLGVTHAEVGAYLLGIWGLPYSIVEAVAHHHHPGRAGYQELDVVGAVHLGGALAEEVSPKSATHIGSGTHIDPEYLARLGLEGQLDAFRKIARDELAGVRSW